MSAYLVCSIGLLLFCVVRDALAISNQEMPRRTWLGLCLGLMINVELLMWATIVLTKSAS